MPCGSCGGGKASARNGPRGPNQNLPPEYATLVDSSLTSMTPSDWGPHMWQILHTIAERIGKSQLMYNYDQVIHFKWLINSLPIVLPCQQCQQDAQKYLNANPLPEWELLRDSAITDAIREWLFTFHNSVRRRLKQTIIYNSPDEMKEVYQLKTVDKDTMNTLSKYMMLGVQEGVVHIDNWKRWATQFQMLRDLTGL